MVSPLYGTGKAPSRLCLVSRVYAPLAYSVAVCNGFMPVPRLWTGVWYLGLFFLENVMSGIHAGLP